MLVVRAFVLGVSSRAVLAVLAIALAVAYALVSAGVLTVLDTTGEALEEDRGHPGHALHRADLSPFPALEAPSGATFVYHSSIDGVQVATIEPWPFETDDAIEGPYMAPIPADWPHLAGRNRTTASYDHAPLDALIVHPDDYRTLPGREPDPYLAFVAGATAPVTTLRATPWQGLAAFYEGGAAQLTGGLLFVILASGAVVALLASGFVHLEVLARRGDLATLEALAGARQVRAVVLGRTLALVSAGGSLGTLTALLVLRVAGSAAGQPLSPGSDALVLTILATMVGGTAFGTFAGWRALARDPAARLAGGRLAARRFPGPVRFLFVTPRLTAGVFTATVVTASILAVLSSAATVPALLFQTDDEDGTVVVEGSDNPLRGTADRVLGTHGTSSPGVLASHAETYAPTVVRDRPVMVKGVEWAAWREWTGASKEDGAWPDAPGEAMVGSRFARHADIAVGDHLVIPASYRVGVERVEVVGLFSGSGLEDDELLVDLDTAGRLADLPPNKVTMVHLKLSDPTADWHSFVPRSQVEVVNITVSPQPPVPLTPAQVAIRVENRGPEPATRTLAVRVNGVVQEERTVTLRPGEERTETVRFLVPDAPTLKVEVNPTEEAATQRGHFDLLLSNTTARGEPVPLRARFASGAPVANAGVFIDGDLYTATDADGKAVLRFDEEGLYTVSVVRGSGDSAVRAGRQVLVHAPEWRDAPRLVVERLFLDAPTPKGDATVVVRAEATVANLGGARADRHADWTLDGKTVSNVSVSLAPGSRTGFVIDLEMTYGDHVVGFLGTTRPLTVRADRTLESEGTVSRVRTVEDVLAEKRAGGAAGGTTQDPAAAFLDRVFADIDTATALVLVATIVHAGALVWVSVVREVRERASIVALMGALGASPTQVGNRAVRDTTVAALPALVLGLLVTASLLAVGRFFGFPRAFGHTLPTADTLGILVRTGVALAVVALIAASYAVRTERRPRPRARPRRPLPEVLGEP